MESSTADLDAEKLLLTTRAGVLYDEPYVHGCIDDYLPQPTYHRLAECFPETPVLMNYGARSGSDRDAGEHDSFFARHPQWKPVLTFFTSPLFLRDLQAFALPKRRNPAHNWHSRRGASAAADSQNGTPVEVTFKFSSLRRGMWIQPHTDNPQKILSILLYFAEPDWRDSYGGGTEIYEPRVSLLKRNWHNIDVPFEWMHHVRTFAFVPNRLVLLLKSANSWHGVSPLACPDEKERRTLLITVRHCHQMENALQQRVYGSLKAMAVKAIQARMRPRGSIEIQSSLPGS